MTEVGVDRLLTAAELAERLNVTPRWIRSRTSNAIGAIPHFKLGRNVRYQLDDVLEWLREQRRGGGAN